MTGDRLTRRQWLRASAGLLGASAVAGCSGGDATQTAPDDRADVPETTERTATPTRRVGGVTGTATPTASTPTGSPDSPYAAALSPAGVVSFDSVPEDVFTILSHHADMVLALGRGEDVNAVYAVEYTNSLLNAFTPRLDGVTVDWSDLYSSWNPSKEKLYDLESDVHLADPARMVTMGNWDRADVREVREEIAPWFGNSYSAQHGRPPEPYADGYQYYTLWEIFGRVSDVFRERPRYEALAGVRADLLSTIEEGLPPEAERPSVAMILHSTSGDGMWAYRVNAPGYHAAHTRPLGALDAMAEVGVETGAKVDSETLLEADPDVIFTLGGVVDAHDMPAIRDQLADDPVASQVTAVQDDRIHAQGTRHQGPLVNLFQLEMTAKQLYPDAFGEWPTYEEGPYPALSADERLFDHDRVGTIVSEGV